jgi:nitroreductase
VTESDKQDLETVSYIHRLTGLPWSGPHRAPMGRLKKPLSSTAVWRPPSQRRFSDCLPDVKIASAIIRLAYGDHDGRRTVPSAGAIYSLSIHAVPLMGGALYPALGNGDLDADGLALIDGDQLASSTYFQIAGNCWLLVIGADPEQCVRKYALRGYRYLLIEAGLVLQELIRESTGHGLHTCVLGAFDDDAITEIIGGKLNRYLPLVLLCLGYSSECEERRS